jgi:peroxiredoxin
MEATLCLLSCALLAAQQPANRTEWLLTPRLNRGQELVYRGSFDEEVLGKGVQFKRGYRLENRVFVLDSPARGLDVAILTVLKLKSAQPVRGEEAAPSSVRLELARVDLQGKLTADPGVSLTLPVNGPATLEPGVFLEIPRGRVRGEETWDITETGRPPCTWKAVGTEVIAGTNCIKLDGSQQSDDWEHPRADQTAWRRREVVWMASRLGVAYRVERILERREPARQEPTQRSVLRYELESTLQYPGQLFEDRRREILQARAFSEAILPLLPNPAKHGPRPFDTVEAKIKHHLENQPPTPYREAIIQVRRRVEAARRGDPAPTPPPDAPPAATVARLGEKAPDFVTTNLLTRESARLRRYLGKPVLMVFYSPTSTTVEEVLGFAQRLQDAHRDAVAVLCFAVSDDTVRVKKQCEEMGLRLPVLSGKGLRLTYTVEDTPKLIVLDPAGVVRASFAGWGPETPGGVREEIKRWLRK